MYVSANHNRGSFFWLFLFYNSIVGYKIHHIPGITIHNLGNLQKCRKIHLLISP